MGRDDVGRDDVGRDDVGRDDMGMGNGEEEERGTSRLNDLGDYLSHHRCQE